MGQALVRPQVASVEDFPADLAYYNPGHGGFDGRKCPLVTRNQHACASFTFSAQSDVSGSITAASRESLECEDAALFAPSPVAEVHE